jgi:hypothetical protein
MCELDLQDIEPVALRGDQSGFGADGLRTVGLSGTGLNNAANAVIGIVGITVMTVDAQSPRIGRVQLPVQPPRA